MIIGNPLYDTIFKYLMEDTEVAKRLIGVLINEEIEELVFAAKEQINVDPSYPLALFRMDFIATILTPEGEKKVLIEVQKAKRPTDIRRFRAYLGKQYADRSQELPIITIYFLGYDLVGIPESVVRVKREITGVLSGRAFDIKHEFVELLTHDSYLIQVKRLRKPLRTPVERVLSVFDQSQKTEEGYFLTYPDEEVPKEAESLVKRLQKITSDKGLKARLELEEELEFEYRMTIGKMETKLSGIESQMQQKQAELEEERQRVQVEKQRAEEEKQRAEEEKQRAEEEKQRAEEEKQRAEEAEQRSSELIEKAVFALSTSGNSAQAIARILGLEINFVEELLANKKD